MLLRDKAKYFLWAASLWGRADRSCPACGSLETTLLKRKYLITGLYKCAQCYLMFRVPKSDEAETRRFYTEQYRQGFTTDCPNTQELERLKLTAFKGTEKDYTTYISVIKAAGLQPGQVIFDFGCSWGYGSWQLAQAGFRVYSYEISLLRACYAAEKLGCQILQDPKDIPEKVDCFFSAHVIEHLLNPKILWIYAMRVLNPKGLVVVFTPNGEPSRERTHHDYHKLWGQVHPLLLSAESLIVMARQNGFGGYAYSPPYDLLKIANRTSGRLDGDELLFVARRV